MAGSDSREFVVSKMLNSSLKNIVPILVAILVSSDSSVFASLQRRRKWLGLLRIIKTTLEASQVRVARLFSFSFASKKEKVAWHAT